VQQIFREKEKSFYSTHLPAKPKGHGKGGMRKMEKKKQRFP